MKIAPGTFEGLHPDEVELFRNALRNVTGIGIEIGCLDGFSTAIILDSAPGLNLFSIDPFIPDSKEPTLIGRKRLLLENVAPYRNRHVFISGYSWDVYPSIGEFLDTDLNFLFIDGDHNYEAVRKDFDQWTPLITPGGLLAMHDARMNRPGGAPFHIGPSSVADQFLFKAPDQWEIIGEAFSLVIARRITT